LQGDVAKSGVKAGESLKSLPIFDRLAMHYSSSCIQQKENCKNVEISSYEND